MADTGTVAQRYAKAAFRAASARGRVEEFAAEVEAAACAVGRHESLVRFWESPVVSLEKKRAVLDHVLGEMEAAPGEDCRRFLALLVKNGRLTALGDIIAEYRRLADAEAGRVRVAVTTAQALSEPQRARLQEALSARLGRQALVNVSEDPALLAGLTVRVGDVLYDSSARGRLDRLLGRLAV